MNDIRLAVVGSTEFIHLQDDYVYDIVRKKILEYNPKVVISGGARGVDTWAKMVVENWNSAAKLHGGEQIEMVEFLPKIKRWAPNGFKDRNILIAQDCTHLVAIRSAHAKTFGSGWTHEYAKKLGKTCELIIL